MGHGEIWKENKVHGLPIGQVKKHLHCSYFSGWNLQFFFIVVPIWHKLIKEQPYVVNICKRHFLTGLFIMNSYKSSYFLSS
jgi:hypothetical protein